MLTNSLLRIALLFSCSLIVVAGPPHSAVILSGTDPADRSTAALMRRLLDESGRFRTAVSEALHGVSERTLQPYDLVVVSSVTGADAVDLGGSLRRYASSSKGVMLVGMHGIGIWSANPAMAARPRSIFPVSLAADKRTPLAGLPATFEATDDLLYNIRPERSSTILATAVDDTAQGGSGKQEPVAWTSRHGKGRVFSLALGNDLSAMYGEGFGDLFLRGCLWAVEGEPVKERPVDLFRFNTNPVRVLVVTGGHSYPTSFYRLFDGYPDVVWDHKTSMLEALRADLRPKYDVLVLHDWYRDVPPEKERKVLIEFLESGRGILILHHAISDFNAWDWWQKEVQGAKYFFKPEGETPASSYEHDHDLHLVPEPDHPVTRSVGPFRLTDEIYKGMWYSPDIQVLVRMASPLKHMPVAWVGPYRQSRVVYILPGHDRRSHDHPAYRKLIHNALLWTAGRGE